MIGNARRSRPCLTGNHGACALHYTASPGEFSRSAAPPRAVPENHLGIFRFWRDLGYAIGALEAAFWFVALSMFASGAVLFVRGEETHPRLNPAD